MLLLFGLILKVQVHAPITEENPAIHTLRSVLVEELLTFEALHPPAKPVSPGRPNQLLNPTSETDLDGRSCLECHPGSRLKAAQIAGYAGREPSFQSHPGLKSGYACETCHFTQLSLVNEGALSR
jgi:hypothetical protein